MIRKILPARLFRPPAMSATRPCTSQGHPRRKGPEDVLFAAHLGPLQRHLPTVPVKRKSEVRSKGYLAEERFRSATRRHPAFCLLCSKNFTNSPQRGRSLRWPSAAPQVGDALSGHACRRSKMCFHKYYQRASGFLHLDFALECANGAAEQNPQN